MDNYCIKVKRRGLNYYGDYMARYFEKVAVNHGYHVTLRQEQADIWCFTIDDETNNNKWITFASPAFNMIDYEQLEELSCLIGECFKSTSIIAPVDEDLNEIIHMTREYLKGTHEFSMTDEQYRKYGFPFIWFFSRDHSAFDEPPFITVGETILENISYPLYCTSGERVLISTQNSGGISKGLMIRISFDYIPGNEIKLKNPVIALPAAKGDLHKHLPLKTEHSVINEKYVFRASLPDFNIPEGVNKYSTKLCGKKGQDERALRSFSLMFIPMGNDELLKTIDVETIPVEYPKNKAVWRAGDAI